MRLLPTWPIAAGSLPAVALVAAIVGATVWRAADVAGRPAARVRE